jgi:hypothetical protein
MKFDGKSYLKDIEKNKKKKKKEEDELNESVRKWKK